MAQDPLVSCLCVTEGRPAFMPWLLWNFDRQTWPHRELVIIDSSAEPLRIIGRDDVRVVTVPYGISVGLKRNLALDKARGEVIAWFDDDDWQHPNKLAMLVEAFSDAAPYAGACRGWFVNLMDSRCVPYRGPKGKITFNSAAFRKEVVLPIRFREDLRRASDTQWMRALDKQYPGKGVLLNRDDLFFWLCHKQNLSNPVGRRCFTKDLEVLKSLIGYEAWGDTDDMLGGVKRRLRGEGRALAVHHASGCEPVASSRNSDAHFWNELRTNDDSMPQVNQRPPVGLMIKATVMDAPYLDTMVRHMISQAQYPFAEKTIIVDRPSAFTGKYARRPRATQEELRRTLDQLLSDRVIDHVRAVDTTPALVREVKERYFSRDAYRISNYAATGGPNYATLYGLESMSTDHVLQMDADVFFYTDSTSWVAEALALLQVHHDLWLMMTHPGPPMGSPGKSLGPRNEQQAIWDESLALWRFQTATTRYFLTDRRRLHGRLRYVPMSGGCAPLERCLSAALRQHGAFRGSLGNLSSWHLHAWYHETPFPEWAPLLAQTIGAGCFPDMQRGNYDLRLDRLHDRQQWQQILAKLPDTQPFIPIAGQEIEETGRPLATPDELHRMSLSDRPPPSRMHRDITPLVQGIERSAVESGRPTLPIAVVIPVRDRAGQRLKRALLSLNWQDAGRPAQVIVVSHGSQPTIAQELTVLCSEWNAALVKMGKPNQPWNKPLALNAGIRSTSPDMPFVMTMDADMILAPNFINVVLEQLTRMCPALVLCRISDLPPDLAIPEGVIELRDSFPLLHSHSQLRPRYGTGAIQAVSRSFLFNIRGYDEDLHWWGAMDGDLVNRSRLGGLNIVWIDGQTAMLHQWHPKKHSILSDPAQAFNARKAWRFNHSLVRARAGILRRNPRGWGGMQEDVKTMVHDRMRTRVHL